MRKILHYTDLTHTVSAGKEQPINSQERKDEMARLLGIEGTDNSFSTSPTKDP